MAAFILSVHERINFCLEHDSSLDAAEGEVDGRAHIQASPRIEAMIGGTELSYGEDMERRNYCVYNQTRECFLSLGVTTADTVFTRLKGLIGKFSMGSDEGLWVIPSSGVHSWGVLFPLDLIYLDENYQVVCVTEHFPRFSVGPLNIRAASVLELPTHTIYSSQTQPGDQLVICMAEEMEERLMHRAAERLTPEESDQMR